MLAVSLTASGTWLDGDQYAQLTPLEEAVGFIAAEEIYDLLSMREQLIIDMMMAGWTQDAIGSLFGIGQSAIGMQIRRIRFVLANTVLQDNDSELIYHYRQPYQKEPPPEQLAIDISDEELV